MLKKAVLSATLLAGLGLQLGAPALAAPVTYVSNDPSKRDVVTFKSNAALELVQGTTHNVKGVIQYDDSFKFDSAHPFKIRFDVDLASVDTGIPLRNQHMRDNFLQTKKYPKATFVATSIRTATKAHPTTSGARVKLMATGNLTIHGVTVKKTVPLYVTYFPEGKFSKQRYKAGDLILVKGRFPVKLEDHKIPVPEALFYKLADTVYVDVSLSATNNASAAGVKKPF